MQPELIDLAEHVEIVERVGRVGVDRQLDRREVGAHRGQEVDVPTRLDLQLDPLVTLVDVATDGLQRLGDRVHAEAGPDGNLGTFATEERAQGTIELASMAIPHCELQRRLGHRVAAPPCPRVAQGHRVVAAALQQCGHQGLAE